MTIFWLVLTLLAAALWIGWLTRVVRQDGLGDREPPPSHPHEDPRAATQIFLR